MSEWQPIETAPKDGRQVLIACPEYIHIAFWNGASWDDGDFQDNLGTFWTHWMPLPNPPATEKETA